MNEVGQDFAKREIFLPGLLASAEAMEAASAIVKEKLRSGQENRAQGPNIILASVQGDVHDIGKNIVKLLLKNSGCNVLDLGKDVSTKDIIEKTESEKVDLIALSALMTTTMVRMKEVADELNRRGMKIPLLLGGAVVTKEYAESIGAHYAVDAAAAPALVKQLTGKS